MQFDFQTMAAVGLLAGIAAIVVYLCWGAFNAEGSDE